MQLISDEKIKMSSVSCSICWEIVTSTCVASFVLCGHVYHHNCLERWLKTSRTCPECRNGIINTKRIYLNLVPDPEIEGLHLELTKKNKEYDFLITGNEIQDAIIKQLEKEMSENILAKDKELLLSTNKNDELKLRTSCMQHENEKLKLDLEIQEKQRANLTNEITDLKNQLAASQTKNIEITNSTVALKEYYREQVKQISDLQAEILNSTERLDQFRALFVAANNKLQLQLQENEVVKNERNSLLKRNSQLTNKMYSLKLQVGNKFLRKIKQKYNDLPRSAVGTCRYRRESRMGFLRTKLEKNHLKKPNKSLQRCGNENLKIKLVKSKLSWVCVKS